MHGRAEAVNPADRHQGRGASTASTSPPVDRPRCACGCAAAAATGAAFAAEFDRILARAPGETDAFYEWSRRRKLDADGRRIFRQALAGMLWTKQHYHFDVARWLEEHDASPFAGEQRSVRNADWFHMVNDHVISMPDKWEYPWYATWDLGFHCLALVLVDPDFAKEQLELMLPGRLHPSQRPAAGL